MKQQALAWMFAISLFLIRRTCRVRPHNDCRKQLNSRGFTHQYATLHAHQIAAMMSSERGVGAMVSRSRDGAIIVPSLRIFGVLPIRGSGGEARKGGATAMTKLIRHVRDGNPSVLAVDGPRGPRGHVHLGIAMLAKKTGQPVLAATLIPTRRWILTKTWDRIQVPKPFSRIDAYFSPPIWIGEEESLEAFAARIEDQLRAMEQLHDPDEADAIGVTSIREAVARAA
jgi:lysophospholipid acyltransferase (LPLAT)-like uncharacterized protein